MTEAKKFDVSLYELDDTGVLTVKNAAGDANLLVDGKPVMITLYGPASPQFVQADHRASNIALKRSMKIYQGNVIDNVAEQVTQETAEKLAACTAEINNFPIEGGALAIYTNPRLVYITNQVEAFLNAWEILPRARLRA